MTTNAVPYRTQRGEMLDQICHNYYGVRPRAVEAVLDANPGLAALGPVIPMNTIIMLPDLGPAEDKSQINLWD